MEKMNKTARIVLLVIGLVLLATGIALIILGAVVFRTYPFGDYNWPWGNQPNMGMIIPGAFLTLFSFGVIGSGAAGRRPNRNVDTFNRWGHNSNMQNGNIPNVSMSNALQDDRAQKPQAARGNSRCAGCGAAVTAGAEKFCQYCGMRH